MRIAGFIQDSIVDGPGLRFVLFAQGCPHRCEGCHNPDTHEPEGGREMSEQEIIDEMLSNPLTDGITLSGGDPFFQAEECAKIAHAAREAGLNVWCYTGYLLEELISSPNKDWRELLELTDVLVDGRFMLSERSLNLKWRGSGNQRIISVRESLDIGSAVLYDR